MVIPSIRVDILLQALKLTEVSLVETSTSSERTLFLRVNYWSGTELPICAKIKGGNIVFLAEVAEAINKQEFIVDEFLEDNIVACQNKGEWYKKLNDYVHLIHNDKEEAVEYFIKYLKGECSL